MIVSVARHPSVFNAACAFILICVSFIPYYFDFADKNNPVFLPEKFVTVFSFAILFCASIMLYILSTKRKIIIDGETIEVHENFGFKKVVFEASEIEEMTWGGSTSKVTTVKRYNNNNNGATIGNRFAEIVFKDGSVLSVDDYNYKNNEELMAWFFSYCRYKGIINIEAIEARKKKRALRRKRKKTV